MPAGVLLPHNAAVSRLFDGSAMSALALKSKAPCTAVKTAG
jgi:hypothetical protein